MLKLFLLHQQHRVKETSLNCFGDAEQHRIRERKNNAWERERNSWIKKREKR